MIDLACKCQSVSRESALVLLRSLRVTLSGTPGKHGMSACTRNPSHEC